VIATARTPSGGETTLIALDAGEFPAIDAALSGTLRAELLIVPAPAKPARVRKPRASRKAPSADADAPAEAGSEPPASAPEPAAEEASEQPQSGAEDAVS